MSTAEPPAESTTESLELYGRLAGHREYIRQHGQDMPEVLGWRWK